MSDKLNELIGTLARRQAVCQTRVNKFITLLQENPSYAMRWADGPARDVAALDVFMRYHTICKDDKFTMELLPAIRDRLLEEIIRSAGNPERSTSVMSNLMSQNTTVAYTEVLEILNQYIEG